MWKCLHGRETNNAFLSLISTSYVLGPLRSERKRSVLFCASARAPLSLDECRPYISSPHHGNGELRLVIIALCHRPDTPRAPRLTNAPSRLALGSRVHAGQSRWRTVRRRMASQTRATVAHGANVGEDVPAPVAPLSRFGCRELRMWIVCRDRVSDLAVWRSSL